MPTKFTVSLVQMNIVPTEVEHNLRTAFSLMEQALIYEPQVFVLPEMWTTDLIGKKHAQFASSTEHVLSKLAPFAKAHQAYILGTMPEVTADQVFNTLYVVAPDGKLAGKYRKNHLFKLTGEDTIYAPGKDTLVLDTPYGKWGTAICFDLRFPEFINKIARGIQVLFVPAQWPWERKEHWEALLRARAIENQIFVVGVNRVGQSNGLEYPGSSFVFDPWGDIVAEGSNGEEVLTCQIDLNKIKEVREKLPMD